MLNGGLRFNGFQLETEDEQFTKVELVKFAIQLRMIDEMEKINSNLIDVETEVQNIHKLIKGSVT